MTDKSKPEPTYDTVWQKLLQEEAAEKAAEARKQARLDYDLAALSDWDVIRPPNFQLGYNLDGLYDPSPLGTNHDDRADDIVVIGQRNTGSQHPHGTARAPFDGVVMRGMTGWQNPNNHNAGMGWRTWIVRNDGSRVGYGHLDPSSTLPEGTQVRQGDPIGRYGNPTNGRSTNPHLHVQAFDRNNRIVAPPVGDPFFGRGRRLRRYGERDAMHRGLRYPAGHQGDDWIEE